MNGLERRRRSRSIFDSWVTLAVFLFITLLLVINAARAYRVYRASLREEAKLEENIKKQISENEALQAQLERFESGEGLELEARERLNVQKPGEHVLIIVDDEKPQRSQEETQEAQGFWARVFQWLKN